MRGGVSEEGGRVGWDPPSSRGPPIVLKFRSVNPLGTEGAEAKLWLSA